MKRKPVAIAVFIVVSVFIIVPWFAGTLLTAPARRKIGELPQDLPGRSIEFPSKSGSRIHGWFLPGRPGQGIIIVMHGVRASRVDMLDRARFLSRAGYAVLLFDFQAHGESAGNQITFGYLESKDARAAVMFAHTIAPDKKVGVIGVSMGGAAVLLADPPLSVDAAVLEQVYPTLRDAIGDRISMRFGAWSEALTPLLSWQLRPRLGISNQALRPVDHVEKMPGPKLFVGGAADQNTTESEVRNMFQVANSPKELWIIPGAEHVDLCRFGKAEYQDRILDFFARYLLTSR